MAAGLPVVAPSIDRMPTLIENGREGLLYDPHNGTALADSLVALADPALRTKLGAAARERCVREYSWAAHCRALEGALLDAQRRRSA
jgi:glycosyltransferase involved in cell wall biosynthesis